MSVTGVLVLGGLTVPPSAARASSGSSAATIATASPA